MAAAGSGRARRSWRRWWPSSTAPWRNSSRPANPNPNPNLTLNLTLTLTLALTLALALTLTLTRTLTLTLKQAGLLGGELPPGGARERDLGAALAKALRREPSRLKRAALRRWEGWLSLNRRRSSLRAGLRDPSAGRALRTWAAHAAARRRAAAALQRLRQQGVARALNSWVALAKARRRARRQVQRVLARATRREVQP